MGEELFDIAFVGAGFGNIYATHRLSREGHSVVGIEGVSDVGSCAPPPTWLSELLRPECRSHLF